MNAAHLPLTGFRLRLLAIQKGNITWPHSCTTAMVSVASLLREYACYKPLQLQTHAACVHTWSIACLYVVPRSLSATFPSSYSANKTHSMSAHFGVSSVHLGAPRDYRKAVDYFLRAAQKGHVLAMYHLGMMHATGTGVLRNCEQAVGLFKNVAERGHWTQQFADAYDAYDSGKIETALVMYMYLGELGYEMAQNNAAHILDELQDDLELFNRNGSLARALLQWKRSADQGHSASLVKIGDYYYYGHATAPDLSAAVQQYRLAADARDAQVRTCP